MRNASKRQDIYIKRRMSQHFIRCWIIFISELQDIGGKKRRESKFKEIIIIALTMESEPMPIEISLTLDGIDIEKRKAREK